MDNVAYANFVCPTCGPTTIVVEDKEQDDSAVSCKACGTKFEQTWGDVKAEAVGKTKDAILRGWRKR
jgi:transcription elongation factor Elf1